MEETFSPEQFVKKFKQKMLIGIIVYGVYITIISIIVTCIQFHNWDFARWLISLSLDTGAVYNGRTLDYGWIELGIFIIGISVTGINTIGVISVGINAIGVVAIGVNACGFIAIGVNAVGIVSIGAWTFGLYGLTYSGKSKSRYLIAPHRQDPKAISLFGFWLPSLSKLGLNSNC
ncbi:hypothetical protein C6497_06225 [Candidatus Poribacteria bacterium]|nr:MAG: hypothetical protein C6497_06225 [Candidatus Poribacteria bacterium]